MGGSLLAALVLENHSREEELGFNPLVNSAPNPCPYVTV
jgi:hypothetical protein